MSTRYEKRRIGPDEAEALLDTMRRRRPMRRAQVDRLAQEIRDGYWNPDASLLLIGESSDLIDGQHRLTAIIETGATVETGVLLDVADDAFFEIDKGVRRSFADTIRHADPDATSPNVRAAVVARLYEAFETGEIRKGAHNASHRDLFDLYNKIDPVDLSNAINQAGRIRYDTSCGPHAVTATAVYLIRDAVARDHGDLDVVDAFEAELRRGRGIGSVFRDWVLRDRVNHRAAKIGNKRILTGVLFKAWDAWRNGDDDFNPHFRSTEPWQFPSGKVFRTEFPEIDLSRRPQENQSDDDQ